MWWFSINLVKTIIIVPRNSPWLGVSINTGSLTYVIGLGALVLHLGNNFSSNNAVVAVNSWLFAVHMKRWPLMPSAILRSIISSNLGANLSFCTSCGRYTYTPYPKTHK
jgi:hypothetical protein